MPETLAKPDSELNRLQALVAELGIPKDLHERAQYIAGMSAGDMVAAVTLLHEILAPDVDPNPYEYKMHAYNVESSHDLDTTITQMTVHSFAEPEDRFPLFQKAADLTHALAEGMEEEQDQAFLNRAGNILALALTEAHPFEDGNGRTARTISYLIRQGGEDEGIHSADSTLGQISMEREQSKLGMNQKPYKRYAEVGITPTELLEAAAAVDIPLSEDQQYQQQASMFFMSPFEEY